jgi:predicted Fe-Mo cluster-binding NifX family protein
MKVAIPRYEQRIAPRFGFTQDVLVVELEGGGVRTTESLPVDRRFPNQIPELLHGRGVRVVLTGGINVDFQEMFRALGIEVIWGLIGTPDEALEAYVSGRLSPGMGRCPGGGRRRRRRGCGMPRP